VSRAREDAAPGTDAASAGRGSEDAARSRVGQALTGGRVTLPALRQPVQTSTLTVRPST
jgi:hypothetical protein